MNLFIYKKNIDFSKKKKNKIWSFLKKSKNDFLDNCFNFCTRVNKCLCTKKLTRYINNVILSVFLFFFKENDCFFGMLNLVLRNRPKKLFVTFDCVLTDDS